MNNGAGNIYTKKAFIRQEINIYNGNSPNNSYVSKSKIQQIDKIIDELIVFEKIINNIPRENVIKKYRGIVKEEYGDGAYNKLTQKNFELAKKYLLGELYKKKSDFVSCLNAKMKDLRPEQLVEIYKLIQHIID